jgi:hypothetical protein
MIAILRLPVKTHWESRESRISLPKLPLGSAGLGWATFRWKGQRILPGCPWIEPAGHKFVVWPRLRGVFVSA